ncbi:MAG: DNA repair protein RecN [Eubacterium sp.]|nr:DNA repair protein RecN [Eubacterium sp.]
MLVNLHIVNLALIDELDVDFAEGLNILTGETGAGKSIIIGSIGIGLGGRFDSSLLRNPDKDGMVELLFSVDEALAESLKEDEIDVQDGELLISRRLAGGKSINRINDSTVTVAKLKKVAEKLISLHAQHEQRTLLKASRHLEIVDSYDSSIAELKEKVAKEYKAYKELSDKLGSFNMDETERAKRLDYIRYEINDIESARLVEGEDDELEELYKKASNAQSIAEITSEVEALTGYDRDSSGGSQVSEALRNLQQLSKYDENADSLISTLTDIDSLISDFNRQLADYISDMEFDEESLRNAEERLNLINTLKARYGRTIQDVLETLGNLQSEEEELAGFEETLKNLEKERDAKLVALAKASDKLTEARKKAAKKLCKVISDAMKDLNFNDVRFDMSFDKSDTFTSNGNDIAEFIISTNVGEDMRPLVNVASGGELSRVMLAIKSVVSEAADTPTLIFDEIDVGISGITAEKVGAAMKRLAASRQIISITHLPQIAACADTAFVIEKEVVGEKTITGIKRLDDEGRVMELARLLGGASVTDSVVAAAREMIAR